MLLNFNSCIVYVVKTKKTGIEGCLLQMLILFFSLFLFLIHAVFSLFLLALNEKIFHMNV